MHPFTSLYLEEILPNLITKTEKQVLREKYKISGYSRIAIAAGRFIRSKRFDLAINAWAILPSDWLLVIAGSGELENEYKALVTNLGLKNVQFPGHLETSKLKEMYHFSDIFILPTEFDVWGLVVNEALASGLPVITTEMCIAGNELIIDNVNGYLFKDGNLQQLINSVLKLMMDENRLNLFSINALLSIKNHTFENVASAHLNAFRQVLSSAC
jgi:glycosyltransferase involved in cell wall biosynthesis